MNIAIIEILALEGCRWIDHLYNLLITRQFTSIMPQVVAVWCRQLGHRVHYATYYGFGDPIELLPADAEIVFFACYTQASPLAYALSKILRSRGVRTVLGGPHAKAFPSDARRFFDCTVGECDKDLVKSIIAGDYPPGSVASGNAISELPSVEERWPEIKTSSLFFGHRLPTTTIGLLSSLGCPYQCDFCIDWNSKYRMLPADKLADDLRFIAAKMPKALLAFHDPNFAVRFDETMAVLERQQTPLPYMMESSLSVLKLERMEKLKKTNCVFVAPGIESWDAYSNKSGGTAGVGAAKVKRVAAHFLELHRSVATLQANFIFGLDTDAGDLPVTLSKQFMDLVPFVWMTVNIPVPFGGTPLFNQLKSDDRILRAMPFRFYYAPYATLKIRNYGPVDYYQKLIDLFEHSSSLAMLRRRAAARPTKTEKLVDAVRTLSTRAELAEYRRILGVMKTDRDVRKFHEGEDGELPAFYRREYARGLGRYASVLTDSDRCPVL
jgi:radical SAM superfamily enzyme YgiQ (UPF0313 family)